MGVPLARLAIAFVGALPSGHLGADLSPPPRATGRPAGRADLELDNAVLDRIDDIVPPGIGVHPDGFYTDPGPLIRDKRLRHRRPTGHLRR
ncbi:hypothetical protein [Streptomyces sp. NPDC059743]|uniref:hypothetical protein n=1 Tax=Streptomyces sp. NPDC059743 TaxID=3346928 RepID=UPI0036683E0B